jgi:hypothetical protein
MRQAARTQSVLPHACHRKLKTALNRKSQSQAQDSLQGSSCQQAQDSLEPQNM